MKRVARRCGFTLVELLVVITIIGVLIALLLPAVQAAREAARRAQCINNMRQIALAAHSYHDTQRCFPPGGIATGICCGTYHYTNWAICLLPFIEQQPLYDRYDQKSYNESSANEFVRQQIVNTYSCPSDLFSTRLESPESGPGSSLQYRHGSYRCVGGSHWDAQTESPVVDTSAGMLCWNVPGQTGFPTFATPQKLAGVYHKVRPGYSAQIAGCEKIANVTDGTANTLAFGEQFAGTTTRRGTFWAYTYANYNASDGYPYSICLMDYDICKAKMGVVDACTNNWSSMHPGGINFATVDGSVHFLTTTINISVFCNLCSMAGGDSSLVP